MARLLPNSTIDGEKIATENYVEGKINPHINNKSNPHGVTKEQVGLGDVANYPLATKELAEQGTLNNRYMTPLRTKEAFDTFINPFNNRLLELENNNNSAIADLSGLSREVAYLKLKQQASERIEGGVLFGDGFDGTRFGLTLSLDRSENISIEEGKLLAKTESEQEVNINQKVITTGARVGGETSGRKFIVTALGHYFYVTLNASTTYVEVYKSADKGLTWSKIIDSPIGSGHTDFAITSNNDGTVIYLAHFINGNALAVKTYNAVTNVQIGNGINVATSLVAVGSVDIACNDTGIVDVVYTAKTSSYGQSFNVLHSYSLTPTSSFTTPVHLTTESSSLVNIYYPIVLIQDDGNPYVTCVYRNTSSEVNSNYGFTTANRNTFTRSTLSSIFKPISGLSATSDARGNIKIARIQTASNGYAELAYAHKSVGTSSFNTSIILNSDANNSVSYVSTTIDTEGLLHVMFYGRYNGTIGIYYTKETESGFTVPTSLTTNGSLLYSAYSRNNPQKIINPPTAIPNGSTATYTLGRTLESVITHSTTAKLVYGINETNFIGGFFRLYGAFTVTVKLEFDDRTETLEVQPSGNPNEFKFTHNVADGKGFYLIFELTRPNVTGGDNDYMDRLIGGIG